MSQQDSPMVTTDPLTARNRTRGPVHEVAPEVLMHPAFINTYVMRTSAGLVMVDPGFRNLGGRVLKAVREWSEAPLHTAVYTHGHVDHAFGLRAFLEAGETPNIIAQENCPARFRRYKLTNGWNARINQRQFSLPRAQFPDDVDWPTLTFRDSLAQRVGDTEILYSAAKGETDDHCYVWVAEHGYLFTGDLVIWNAPNCGNPQKVQRYPVEWADALEAMAGLGAEWLFPGHGLVVHGAEAVRTLLSETAAYLRHIIDQVLERMNAGETPEAIFHAVEADPELAGRPFLLARYDHPKFIVRNLLRLWGGWWNGNAADLMPATWEAQAAEIAVLAGGAAKLVSRGRALLEEGDAVMAAHLAEWATRAEPGGSEAQPGVSEAQPGVSEAQPGVSEAQQLKRDVYARRLAEAETTMEQGIYRATMNDARQALGEEPEVPAPGLPEFGA